MSETTFEPYESDEEENDRKVSIKRSHINALEAKAKTAADNAARAEAAERKLSFAEAGISLADPKLGYFIKGYDGDLTTEAIQAAAQEAGFMAPSAEAVEAQTSAAAAARVNAVAAGALPPTNAAEKQRQYEEAFEQATQTGNWDLFNNMVSQYGPVVGINT